MNIQLLSQWVGLIGGLIGIASTLWVWLNRSSSQLATELDELDKTVTDHGRRIQTLESDVRHLPTKDDFTKLELSLTKLEGKQDATAIGVAGIDRTVRRIETVLMEKA